MNHKPICVLCDKEAITTAAHILVCEEHWKEYDEEGKQYLPYHQRVVWQKLLRAYIQQMWGEYM